MAEQLERRQFVQGAALAVLGATGVASAAAPRAGGALPVAGPGHHALAPLPYPPGALTLTARRDPQVKGFSRQVVEWHHERHQAGYVRALNQVEREMAALGSGGTASAARITELKRREVFNASGLFLHELYWRGLCPGGAAPDPSLAVVAALRREYGSLAAWEADFRRVCTTPNTGWTILALSPTGRLRNYACSYHDLGGVWGSQPLLACDVWEHAYYQDYGADRASYLASYLRLLNWPAVDAGYRRWAGEGA